MLAKFRNGVVDVVAGVVWAVPYYGEDVEEGVVGFVGRLVVELFEDGLDPATGVFDRRRRQFSRRCGF